MNEHITSLPSSKKSKTSLWIAAVFVIGVVAGGIVWLTAQQAQLTQETEVEGSQEQQVEEIRQDVTRMPVVTEKDIIRGNKEARVVLVEYSDLNCQFCQKYHTVLLRLIEKYPELGWVYRHMPLLQSEKQSVVAHCVLQEYGENYFWQFVDRYFSQVTSTATSQTQDGYKSVLEDIAVDVGVIESCSENAAVKEHIARQKQSADDIGIVGTPSTVLVVNGQPTALIEGAVGYEEMEEYMKFYIDK